MHEAGRPRGRMSTPPITARLRTDARRGRPAPLGRLAASFVSSMAIALILVAPAAAAAPTTAPNPSASPVTSPAASVAPSAAPCPSPIASPAAVDAASVAPSTVPSSPPTVSPGSSASPGPIPSTDPCAVAVMPQIGMGVGPSQVVLDEQTQQGTFSVYNAGDTDEVFAVQPFDFEVDADGHQVPATEPVPLGAAAWLTADPATFTLAPMESQTVTFHVEVPDGATPGDHYAGLRVLGTMSDDAWSQLESTLGPRITMRSRVAFPVTVVARVPGEVAPIIEAPQILPPLIATISGDYVLTPRIVNKGNTAAVWHVAPGEAGDPDALVPTLRLASAVGPLADDRLLYATTSGDQPGTRPASVLVLPGASITQQLTVRDAPMFGSYDYVYTLPGDAADGRAPITATGHLLIINVSKILLFVAVPLLLLLALATFVLVRRRQRARQRQRAVWQRHQELELVRLQALEQGRQEEAMRRGSTW